MMTDDKNPSLIQVPKGAAISAPPVLDFWSQRYENEGALWGEEPSVCANIVKDMVQGGSRVFEFGYGYGRDIRALARHGHTVYGIDESAVGHRMASERLNALTVEEGMKESPLTSGRVFLITGDFKTYRMPQNDFDAVYSHRTIHLIHPKRVDTIITSMTSMLKPGGVIVLSARNPQDFNPEQMEAIAYKPGTNIPMSARYKAPERSGHIVNFMDSDIIRGHLSERYNIVSIRDITEIESMNNIDPDTNQPHMTHCTVVVARKKFDDEYRQIDRSESEAGHTGNNGNHQDMRSGSIRAFAPRRIAAAAVPHASVGSAVAVAADAQQQPPAPTAAL